MSDQPNRSLGMDVSRYRGRIDWQQVKEDDSVFFCFAKATQATSYVDPTFDADWLGMRGISLIRGAYHYFEPIHDPVAQADNHLRILEGILHPTDLPPVLDVEYWPLWAREQWDRFTVPQRIERIRSWLDHVERAIGRKPIIYTSANSWAVITGDSQAFTDYAVWVANYGVASPLMPAGNWGGNGFTFWQFTDRGDIPGTNPPTDLNWFNGTLEQLREMSGLTEPRPLPPEVTNLGLLLAIRKAAEELGMGHDELIDKAGLPQLRDSRNYDRPYCGLALEEMALTPEEAEALRIALDEVTEDEEPPLSLMTNQDVVNGFFRAAEKLGMPGWALVAQAGQEELVNDRLALYAGPPIEELPGLDEVQKNALLEALGFERIPIEAPDEATYPGVTNQDMINMFYKAAAIFNLNGWALIDRANLENMAASPEERAKPYAGPKIDDLPNLSEGEKAAIQAAMEAQFDTTPNPNP